MKAISKRSGRFRLQNTATSGRSLQPPRNQNKGAETAPSPRPGSRKARIRRTKALSAELDRFLEEVFEAVSAAMTARRWQDISPMLEVYAAAHVGVTAARLFHGAIAHRLATHALSLTDRTRLAESLAALEAEVLCARKPPPLTETIEKYRLTSQHRDALDAFTAMAAVRASKEVH